MTWTLKLDKFSHDITFGGNKVNRIAGSDEVRQRVKVALGHYLGEYFLDTTTGVPWYKEILGRKNGADEVGQIIRAKILNVPDVLSISKFSIIYDSITRAFAVDSDIVVKAGLNEESTITNIDLNI